MLHRDLKPANILIEASSGTPRVIDFGLAKFAEEDLAATLTMEGQALGTPMYMAPELLDCGRRNASTRSDVYALGVVLYVLLADATPYDASLSQLELLSAVRSRPPVPILTAAPGLPKDLAAIVRRAMAREAGERYAGAGALADDVRRYLAGLPVAACRSSVFYTTTKFARRHWKKLTAVALVLLSLTGAGLWHLHKINERTAVASAAYREARNQMAWTIFQGAKMFQEVGRSDSVSKLLGPAESFPWDLPIDDGGKANPAWEAALIKARIQFLNGEIRLGQGDPVTAAARFAAAAALARQAADDPAASPESLGYWFEYQAARLRAQSLAGTVSAEVVIAWLEECRTFPEARWKHMLSARAQTAAGVLAVAMPLLHKHDPRAASLWLAEVTGWLAARIEKEPRDVGSLKSQAKLADAAAHCVTGEAALAAWEKAAAAWQEGRKFWPLHADFGEGVSRANTEIVRYALETGDLDRACVAWRSSFSVFKALRENFIFGEGQAMEEALFRVTIPLGQRLHTAARNADALELSESLPLIWKGAGHNLSPARVVNGKIPDLWPLLTEGRLLEARVFVAHHRPQQSWNSFQSAYDLSRDLPNLFPQEKARWVLFRAALLLEWSAVIVPEPGEYTPLYQLRRANGLLQQTGPLDAAQQREAARLKALIQEAQAALPQKKVSLE